MKELQPRDAKPGRPVAVVVSRQEWTGLKSQVPTFADLLLAVAWLDQDDLPKRKPVRITREGTPDPSADPVRAARRSLIQPGHRPAET